jgi:hypothetical protein
VPDVVVDAVHRLPRCFLDSGKNALYNIAGNVVRRDPTAAAGTDLGRELDFAAQV